MPCSGGGYPSMHCRWYPSMPCSRGVCYPSMHCRWYPSMPCSRGCAIPVCLAAGGGCLLPGGYLVRGICSRGVCWCCGRYASYWNAFLLLLSFVPGTNRGNNSTCWGFFEMPQVPFAFDFESEWPNDNLVTKQSPNYNLSDSDKVGQTANGNS